MSLTMQHILSDAQSLCTRLKDHESLADRLIAQAQSLYKQVDAMKQYKEEVTELNEAAHQKPRDVLVQGIQQENRDLRELQQENKELRNALEEHQNTLEIIMSKYRKQVTQLMQMNKSDREVSREANQRMMGQIGRAAMDDAQADKIREMVAVMRHACTLDEQGEYAAAERIAQLTEENRGLRELLRVGHSYNTSFTAPSPGATSSLTVRRRSNASTSTPEGSTVAECGFQTVRRRLPTAAGAPPTLLMPEQEDASDDPSTTAQAAGVATEVTKAEVAAKAADPPAAPAAQPPVSSPAQVVPKTPDHPSPKPPSQSPPKPDAPAAQKSPPKPAPPVKAAPVTSKVAAQSPPKAAVPASKVQVNTMPAPKPVSPASKTSPSPPKSGPSSPKTDSLPVKTEPSPPKDEPSTPNAATPVKTAVKTSPSAKPGTPPKTDRLAPAPSSPEAAPVWNGGEVAPLSDDSDSSEASVVSQVERHA